MSRAHNQEQSFVVALAKVRAEPITAAATIPEQAERPGCCSDTSANVAKPDKRNRHPIGEWTREPTTEAGYYWVRKFAHPRIAKAVQYLASGTTLFTDSERWSICLEPPKP